MMDQLTLLLGEDISQALGWTLIHSLWQVSLLALIMSGIHKVYSHKSSLFQYNVALATMVSALVISTITFCIYFSNTSQLADVAQLVPIPNLESTTLSQEVSILDSFNRFFVDNIHQINMIWSMGIILFLLRFVASYLYVKYIKTSAVIIEDSALKNKLSDLRSTLQLNKAVQLAESVKISVPMVIGYIKPMILFPIGMVNMLSPIEIEAILVHELTHIKRNDYLINMGITLIEIIYYFHPAMWWISANIKSERENCCDDAAISYNIDSVTYAKALVKLEEIRKAGIPALAMPFASNKHQLLNRIKRILNMEQTKNDIREKSIATLLLMFVVILFASNTVVSTPNIELEKETFISTDTTRIAADEEIIVAFDEGIFSSLTLDGNIQKEGEMVQKLKERYSIKNLESSKERFKAFRMKGNPQLQFHDETFMLLGDEAIIEGDDDFRSIQADTLPTTLQYDDEQINITIEKNGERIEVQKENGKITKLKIDGKEIPESDYDHYQDQINAATKNFQYKKGDSNVFRFETDDFKGFKNMDSLFSNSFGMMFDGENWRQFGGNMQQLLDEDVFDKLKEMEGLRFEELEGLERLEGLENLELLEGLKGLEQLENLEGLEQLGDFLENLGLQLDSTAHRFEFHFDDFGNMQDLENLRNFDIENFHFDKNRMGIIDNQTVVDVIGSALNKDGLLNAYKSNRIELSGKHLKINGEKMPKALFNKYKNIYQEETGAPLTKKSKMVFDVEGKPSTRKIRTF